jgi:hypothetical protein
LYSLETLDAIFSEKKVDKHSGYQIFQTACHYLLHHPKFVESNLIDLICLLKKQFNLEDYCDVIMLSNPFREDSFLHSIAQRKYAQLTLFFLEELNQLIDLNLITKQQLNKLFNALKYQSTALMLICRMGDDTIFVKFFSVLINAYGQDLIDQHILKDLLTKTEGFFSIRCICFLTMLAFIQLTIF